MNPSNDNRLSERDEQRLRAAENTAYSYKIVSYSALLLAGIALAVAAVSIGVASGDNGGQAPAAATAAAPASPGTSVTVAMHDPGCHSFLVGQNYQTSQTVTGPAVLTNSDEDTLNIVGPSGTHGRMTATDAVGQKITLAPGTYTITMVKQAPDDNTLHLTVN